MSFPTAILVLAWVGAIAGPVIAFLIIRRLHRGRRIFLARSLGVLVALAWGLGVWAFLVEPRTLVVRYVTVETATWQGPPLRIGIISDTHVAAPHVDVPRVRRLVRRMNAEQPDIVLLLGDYTGGHLPADQRRSREATQILAGVEAFAGLSSPLGSHGVLGNHDSWFDEGQIAAAMTRGQVTPLRNEALRISRPGGDFWIAGIADLESPTRPASLRQTLAGISDTTPVIAITHWPDPFEQVPRDVALTLAGHTHCGQVNLPLIGRPLLPSPGSYRWPCGLYDVGGRKLFVTGGIGVSILPVRFRASPEMVILTLKAPT